MATGYSDFSPGLGWHLRPKPSPGFVVQLFDSASSFGLGGKHTLEISVGVRKALLVKVAFGAIGIT